MTGLLTDLLARCAAQVEVPETDIAALVRQGERRLRGRRVGAMAAAVAAVLAVMLVVTLGRGRVGAPEPIKQPDKDKTPGRVDAAAPDTRRLTYVHGRTIHWGDRSIDAGREVVSLHVTDDGVAFTDARGDIWFAAGSRTERVGTLGDGRIDQNPAYGHLGRVSSGNQGPLLSWFEVRPGRRDLVVYDTHARKVLVRVPAGAPDSWVAPDYSGVSFLAMTADTAYASCDGRADFCSRLPDQRILRYDLRTGAHTFIVEAAYQAELRTYRRALVVGDTRRAGSAFEGAGVDFRHLGTRLVALRGRDIHTGVPTSAFVAGRRRALDLRLPTGVRGAHEVHAFQWLDDDRLALWAGMTRGDNDLLICRISSGACAVAVDGSAVDVIPGFPGHNA